MKYIIDFFNSFLGGAFVGFVLSNLINFIELGMIMKMMNDIQKMMKDFKAEGQKDTWLK